MLKKFVTSAVVLLLCVGTLEWHQRSDVPTRWQWVTEYEIMDNVPVWKASGPETLTVRNDDCATDRPANIVLLGDSIFYGVRLRPEDTLGLSLSRSLKRADDSAACVVNLSIPGFTLQQEVAVLKHNWEQLKPSIVVLEIWHNSPHRVTEVGGKVFNFGRLVVDEGGIPNPFNVPSSMNRSLFTNSALWRRAIEGFANKGVMASQQWEDTLHVIENFHSWLNERDIELVLVFATKLGTPWSEGREIERRSYSTVAEWAEASATPTLWFEDVLSGQDVEDVRLDTCCHLNQTGMALVSESLSKMLQPMLLETAKTDASNEP